MSAYRAIVREPCPDCEGENVYVSYNDRRTLVVCPDCRHTGDARHDDVGGGR